MKTIIKTIMFSLVVLFFIAIPAYAAPGPDIFVINNDEKKCGYYSFHDEYKGYPLPEGWIRPEYSQNSRLSITRDWEEECQKMGYTYIGDARPTLGKTISSTIGNFAYHNKIPWLLSKPMSFFMALLFYISFLSLLMGIVLSFINLFKKRNYKSKVMIICSCLIFLSYFLWLIYIRSFMV